MTAEAWAAELGIQTSEVRRRYGKGWKPGDPKKHRAGYGRAFRLNGERLTIPEIGRRAGISRQAAYLRAAKYGDAARLLAPKVKGKPPQKWEYKGRLLTIKELAEKAGISHQLMYHRLENGESVEHAMRPVGQVGRKKAIYSLNGEQLSLCDLSAKYGVSHSTLYHRLHQGWTVAQACGLVAPPGKD